MKNQTVKYLKYAIGEIVLVVIGILIALQINNWNENQKIDVKRQEYYAQLLDDLESDISFSKNIIVDYSNYLKNYEAYLSAFDKGELTPINAYEQISKLPFITNPFTFNTSTIESLQNSGDIGLIPPNIRNKLIDLSRFQKLIIKRNELVADGKSGIIQQIAPLIGSTTLPERLENQPKLKDYLNIESKLKELILLYEGIHRWKSLIEKETIERMKILLKEIDMIVFLIQKELKT